MRGVVSAGKLIIVTFWLIIQYITDALADKPRQPNLILLQQALDLEKLSRYERYVFLDLLWEEYRTVSPFNDKAREFLYRLVEDKYITQAYFDKKFPKYGLDDPDSRSL